MIALFIALLVVSFVAIVLYRQLIQKQRQAYIQEAVLPSGLFAKLIAKHPQLTQKDCQLIAQGLRSFFLAHLKSGKKFVSMPSQVADDLWHELILSTRYYENFCKKAFGQFLHHSPAVSLNSGNGKQLKNEGLRRVWYYTCKEVNINPSQPSRLPLLFALDAKFNIENGFRYAADCSGIRRDTGNSKDGSTPYCGGDFADQSIDGSSDGFGVSVSSDGGGGDGCGSGCGGD